ncbi:deoxyribose-phosphate aldolase [Methanobacterium oryzae]|uniref:deoxyribose-phosphate aldolase n=1 Tax=Methanobacterium oryzae TaxID=69540 RepID=UPI003D1F541E
MDLGKSPKEIAKMIDHTNLKPDATLKDIEKLCDEAIKYSFASVCVNPSYVSFSKDILKDTDIKVCTVVGFPLGANTAKIKFFETTDALKNGADEIDMVINIGALKSGLDDEIKSDITGVVAAAEGKVVKVIIETGLLTEDEKLRACEACKEAGANFVKTSTGFGVSGATVKDIKLIKENIGSNMGIKASGGIRDLKTSLDMINAGTTRIGTSSGVQIMEELMNR